MRLALIAPLCHTGPRWSDMEPQTLKLYDTAKDNGLFGRLAPTCWLSCLLAYGQYQPTYARYYNSNGTLPFAAEGRGQTEDGRGRG
jgi:hypothetical protein